MCGRYAVTLPPEAMRNLFRLDGVVPYTPSLDLRPTQMAPVIQGSALVLRRWGFKAPAGSLLINARLEGVGDKPTFRGAFKSQRALVPMDAYYEWQLGPMGKTPYRLAGADGAPRAAAGLIMADQSFVIMTRAADPDIAIIHDRMPVFIAKTAWQTWLEHAPFTDAMIATDKLEAVPARPETFKTKHRPSPQGDLFS